MKKGFDKPFDFCRPAKHHVDSFNAVEKQE